MLKSCLIFLCIDLLVTCMPTSKLVQDELKLLNQEIQGNLAAILNDTKIQVVTMGPSNMMVPVFVPVSKEKQCAHLKLKAFIQLLKQWNYNEVTYIINQLQNFEERLTPQPKSDQECKTEEYQHQEFREFLKNLKMLMQELYVLKGTVND